MLTPSLYRTPVAMVFLALSDPAKSTKWNFATILSGLSADSASLSDFRVPSIKIVKMACDRLLVLFIAVAAVTLLTDPISNCSMVLLKSLTLTSVRLAMTTPFKGSSRRSTMQSSLILLDGDNKSYNFSLYSSTKATRMQKS